MAHSHHPRIDSGAHNLAMGGLERFPNQRHVLDRLDMVDSKIFQARNCDMLWHALLLHHVSRNYHCPTGKDDHNR